MRRRVCFVAFVCSLAQAAWSADALPRRVWKVGDANREALVYVPKTAKTADTPVVFAFHGHGGTMKSAVDSYPFPKLWPQAISVYPQGLKTPSKLTDPTGKMAGWQYGPGEQDDRDLKFFDVMLESFQKDYKLDEKRVYVTGHSNGGAFTYLLWFQRADRLAAIAPCAAAAGFGRIKPTPVFHLAGEKDPIIKIESQTRTIEQLRKLNGCGEGTAWEKQPWCQLYPSESGTPVVACIHPGGHELPPTVPAMIVKFFKEQAQK